MIIFKNERVAIAHGFMKWTLPQGEDNPGLSFKPTPVKVHDFVNQ